MVGSKRGDLVLSLTRLMMRWLIRFLIISVVSLSSVNAQPATPVQSVALPQAIYSPQPVYRPEWAKQGLAGKGVVLVTIDPRTGMVTGTRMLQSTGSPLLDGAALETYSKWRFKPGSVPQVKMPIEFASRPKTATIQASPETAGNSLRLTDSPRRWRGSDHDEEKKDVKVIVSRPPPNGADGVIH